jgi:hypothetical protein
MTDFGAWDALGEAPETDFLQFLKISKFDNFGLLKINQNDFHCFIPPQFCTKI